jgi:hypothetical protein
MQRPTVGFGVGFISSSGRPLISHGVAEGKKKKWMQDVKIKRKGICTGKKLGSPSCPPGSKQYALAKTFKKTAAKGGRSAAKKK